MKVLRHFALALFCALLSGGAASQNYPAGPMRMVVPFPPGGGTDIVARLLAPKMSAAMGQPVVVENRAGAAGAIGSDLVAKSAPDGYTLLLTTPGTHGSIQFVQRNVPYDPVRDFTPVTAAATQSGLWLVNAAFPAKTFKDLVEFGRRNAGKLSYGTAGVGSSFHIMGEIIRVSTGMDMVHVPYKGGAPVTQAIASGEVPLVLVSNTSGIASVKSGKALAVAVLSDKRLPELPDAPLIGDLIPGVERPGDWLGVYGPGGLPAPILARVHAEIAAALKAPEVVTGLHNTGMEPLGNTPEQFAAMLRRDIELYRKMVPIAGIKPE